MHEMGIALQIIEITTASLPADLGEARVAAVNLKVGKMAAVIPDSLRFCFDAAIKDTPLAGAKLAIEVIPVVARCKDCNTRWTIDEPVFVCQTCESGSLEIISGRELDIESIEVVEEEKNDSMRFIQK